MNPDPRWADDRHESAEWRARRRQGCAAELLATLALGVGACAIVHGADADMDQAVRDSETFPLWVWAVILIPGSELIGFSCALLGFHAGCRVELRRPLPD